MLRRSLHSRPIDDSGPVYGALPSDITTSESAYPAFPTSVQDGDPTIVHNYDHATTPLEHTEGSHAPNSHLHYQISNNGLHSNHGIEQPPSQQHHGASVDSGYPQSRLESFDSPPQFMPNTAAPGHFDMLPPPASTHSSWQALHDYAQSHASAHGYALSINTTAKNRARIKLACVCYGAPKNTHKLTPETRVRKNRVSYKTGCRMWVEGKKQEDGSWLLRVGEPSHNHPGRSIEGWAVQRKRTWGLQGGRIGVGGVTAKEEKEIQDGGIAHTAENVEAEEHILSPLQPRKESHSLERGGLVWRIVEQEMLRKNGPGQGRDRGVGRTVKVLEERLPGIHIFKRDVYNIRAQIKRARKAAGQEIGEGLDDSEPEDEDSVLQHHGRRLENGLEHIENDPTELGRRSYPEIDPLLVAQCNDALKTVTQQEESEIERLRREVQELRHELDQRNKDVEVMASENERLRTQLELANTALYNDRV